MSSSFVRKFNGEGPCLEEAVHDTQEETAAVCQYHSEEKRLRQMRQHYLELLCLEAILKAGSHTSSCPVLPVLPHPVGVTSYLAKRRISSR